METSTHMVKIKVEIWGDAFTSQGTPKIEARICKMEYKDLMHQMTKGGVKCRFLSLHEKHTTYGG